MSNDSVKGEIKVLGIDLSKNSFQLHGVDAGGNVVLSRRVSRKRLLLPCNFGRHRIEVLL